MAKFIVSFYSDLEELAVLRTNTAIKNILNVMDFADLTQEERSKLRKVILDEVNGMRKDMLDYFKKSRNGE